MVWSMSAGKRLAIESDSDSNSMDDVEPDSDRDYDSDKDPAWKPHIASHSHSLAAATAAASVSDNSLTIGNIWFGLRGACARYSNSSESVKTCLMCSR